MCIRTFNIWLWRLRKFPFHRFLARIGFEDILCGTKVLENDLPLINLASASLLEVCTILVKLLINNNNNDNNLFDSIYTKKKKIDLSAVIFLTV